ncbi:hypothetical protein BRADI_3g08245v3 [Brachypodium distachyon]|uniref:Uncharacterized protein n=1 Tax=Brachypodium distachyon TaxID=15368 RepID=A0A2K2CVY1_BRADI|nr:hypothetical protein BRADI_3g08245v3 [Brachypodium distachyon]
MARVSAKEGGQGQQGRPRPLHPCASVRTYVHHHPQITASDTWYTYKKGEAHVRQRKEEPFVERSLIRSTCDPTMQGEIR